MVRIRNPNSDKENKRWFWLTVIVLLAAILRFYDLGGESYWFDEVIMLDVAKQDLWTILQGSRPQIYVILAHFWLEVFGTSEVATRSLSALAGVISIPLMYAVGKQIFDNKVGLISAFLMAISQFQIYYSQDFRYYSFFTLMTLCSFYFFLTFLENRKVIYFVFYVLSSILLFYTHTFGVFIIIVQSLCFILKWNRYNKLKVRWYLCQTIIFLAILPRLISTMGKVLIGKANPMTWLPEPSVLSPLITIQYFIGSGIDYPTWKTITLGSAFFLGGTITYALRMGMNQWISYIKNFSMDYEYRNKAGEILLVFLWLIIPILFPLVLSEIFGPMYHNRYLISASPALYILLAILITMIRKIFPEVMSLGLLIIVISPGLYDFYAMPVKEQWRDAAAFVEQNSQENDLIVVSEIGKDNNLRNFNWYYRGKLSECSIGVRLNRGDEIKEELERCISGHKRFWLVMREEPIDIQDFKKFFFDGDSSLQLIRKHEFTKLSVYLFGIKGGVLNTN